MGKFSLIIVSTLFLLLTYFVISANNTSTMTLQRNIESYYYNQAKNIANSAAQMVVALIIEKDPGWAISGQDGPITPPQFTTFRNWEAVGGRFKVKEMVKAGNFLYLTFTGEVASYEYDTVVDMRRIETTSTIFDYAAYSKYDLTIYQNGYVDSFNSNVGNNLMKNANVGYGPEGVFTNNGTVHGSVSHKVEKDMAPVVDPGGGTLLTIPDESMTISEGEYRVTDNVSLAGNTLITIDGDVTLYVEGDISTTGNAEIRISAGSSLTLFLHGTLDNRGNGLVNDTGVASNMLIYGTENCNIIVDLQGSTNTSFTGAIYAPEAKIAIRGGNNFTVYGSVIGRDVEIYRSLIYDEALSEFESEYVTPVSRFYVLSWR